MKKTLEDISKNSLKITKQLIINQKRIVENSETSKMQEPSINVCKYRKGNICGRFPWSKLHCSNYQGGAG